MSEEADKVSKKRGRKPKGGKIIHPVAPIVHHKEEKTNVILHLKCSMQDLQTTFSSSVDFYTKETTPYEFIINNNNDDDDYNKHIGENVMPTTTTTVTTSPHCITKDLWKKLKQLEHNLHINNVQHKHSACFWDTCDFDNPPIYIPKFFMNGTYHVYGCFCSPECAVSYLMNQPIESSVKFERYHLLNHLYGKIYEYTKNIKPAPDPYHLLEKYYGNLSIQEYRLLLRNERLFMVLEKPLTRILPELHEDNDEFIVNHKMISSNNPIQRNKKNKSSVLSETFGDCKKMVVVEREFIS